jgi:molybdate transport system substrate-binding protein
MHRLRILASNGVKSALEELGPAFERASRHKLAIRFGLGADLKRRIEAGEAFDLAMLAAAALEGLAKQGKVDAGSRAWIARSGSGLAIRKGAARPDIGTVDALKRTLLSAKSICWAKEGVSGAYFAGLVERLGIAGEIKPKATLASSGDEVGRLVAEGKCELGVILVNEIMAAPGVELAGPFPREVQSYTEFQAAVASGSGNAAAARELVAFLKQPSSGAVFRAKGQEPA